MGTEMTGSADLKLIVDLRYAAERELTPVPWPAGFGGRTLAHSFERQTEAPHVQAERLGGGREGIQAFYRVMYSALPLTAPYRNLFATALQDMSSLPGSALIHCTAGKDRTGMLVALALHALGIEREAIVADFIATRAAEGMELLRAELTTRPDPTWGSRFSEELIDELLDIRPDYLEAMFSSLAHEHGTIDGFLDSLGLTGDRRAAWRDVVLH
jgi:protein tyrosine/serine phosphatase